jgi:hypothetical protein
MNLNWARCSIERQYPSRMQYEGAGQTALLTRALPNAEDHHVRFPWQPEEYERTCVECGYTWRVPRSAARRRRRFISTFMAAPGGRTIDRPELAREIASIEAMKEPAEVFRQCPKCGAEHFTQRAWHGQ